MAQAKLVSSKQYYVDAANKVQHAKHRIYLICLTMYRDEATVPLIYELLKAAKRGVEVNVAADSITLFNAIHSVRRIRKNAIKPTRKLEKEFKKVGASFTLLGRKELSFIGRTHSKWLVVDDTVFAFGGVNIELEATQNTDFMLTTTDKKLADSIVQQQRYIEKSDKTNRMSRNQTVQTDFGTVLFDGSTLCKSAIYDRAVELARDAKDILLVSQYSPSGKLNRILKRKGARIYFNPRDNANRWFNRLLIHPKPGHVSHDNLYQRSKYLHAKFIIFTMPDGRKTVLTGSHNFSSMLSRLGTREVALETTNPDIIKQIEKFFKEEVK